MIAILLATSICRGPDVAEKYGVVSITLHRRYAHIAALLKVLLPSR